MLKNLVKVLFKMDFCTFSQTVLEQNTHYQCNWFQNIQSLCKKNKKMLSFP